MSREVKKYKFNKNHIEIFTIKDPEIPIFKIPVFEQRSSSLYVHHKFYGLYENKPLFKEVRKKSPLGFYYMSKQIVRNNEDHEIKDSAVSRTIITIPMSGEKNTYYQIKYVTQYGENKIGKEDGLRPWDIYPGDKSFDDNMLESLVKDVNEFFNIAKEAGITSFSKNPYSPHYFRNERTDSINFNVVKNTVFAELFGNENGPRFQTNLEKILAHGFDPKYSFRKDKEKK